MNSELQEALIREEQEMKDSIFQLAKENIKASELKSAEEMEAEVRKNIDIAFAGFVTDWMYGLTLYIEKVENSEVKQLASIINKIIDNAKQYAMKQPLNEASQMTRGDINFLSEVANRQLQQNEYLTAAYMFRIIMKLNPFDSIGWIGWAICEKEQENFDVATEAYEQALCLMPDDVDLCTFAVRYFVAQGRKDRAKEILQEAIEIRKNEETQDESLIKLLNSL